MCVNIVYVSRVLKPQSNSSMFFCRSLSGNDQMRLVSSLYPPLFCLFGTCFFLFRRSVQMRGNKPALPSQPTPKKQLGKRRTKRERWIFSWKGRREAKHNKKKKKEERERGQQSTAITKEQLAVPDSVRLSRSLSLSFYRVYASLREKNRRSSWQIYWARRREEDSKPAESKKAYKISREIRFDATTLVSDSSWQFARWMCLTLAQPTVKFTA